MQAVKLSLLLFKLGCEDVDSSRFLVIGVGLFVDQLGALVFEINQELHVLLHLGKLVVQVPFFRCVALIQGFQGCRLLLFLF